MRVAVGAMMHETNTFTTGRTIYEDFHPVSGKDVFACPEWLNETPAGGIIETLQSQGIEVVPTLFAKALPSGIVEAEAYKKLKEGIINGIIRAGSLDGVCLALHGSMYAEGVNDPEGDLLTDLRRKLGPNVPIVCALDMHATVTEAMVKAADGFAGYRTAPHIDLYETGYRAAGILLKSLQDHKSLVVEWIRLPMLLAGEQSETATSPMRELISNLEEMEQQEGIFSASYLLGFPWADSPHNGVSAVVVGDAKARELVRKSVETLAQNFWDRRHEFDFTTKAYRLDEALRRALESDKSPVIIADSGDNPTAGASEDMTLVLKRMLEMKMEKALVAVIVDAKALEICTERGEGVGVHLQLGRIKPAPTGAPLDVKGRVIKLGTAHGIESAVVDITGITVIITGKRVAVYDPTFLTELDLSPGDFKVIVIKSGYLSPEYEEIAAEKILALTPGDTNEILSELPFKVTPRPIFPLDEETSWSL